MLKYFFVFFIVSQVAHSDPPPRLITLAEIKLPVATTLLNVVHPEKTEDQIYTQGHSSLQCAVEFPSKLYVRFIPQNEEFEILGYSPKQTDPSLHFLQTTAVVRCNQPGQVLPECQQLSMNDFEQLFRFFQKNIGPAVAQHFDELQLKSVRTGKPLSVKCFSPSAGISEDEILLELSKGILVPEY